ncbi:GNAT family N-acetyltransferase [Guptibacillus algicola]|uniref:GNAT family N-acetyltransferase n=1 Tax=Guptibacillus algicola TaxID=225844 RepID=UPI001CD54D93|nr:GNAT family N-acetyltransferase [Alkalihalobacillus algicola]MCA0989023.1 GNAT family N-acetyltransferase [Alkalihalobacillus algicola]
MKIRKAVVEDSTDIARVHVNSWRTTYQGIVPSIFLESLDMKVREARWKKGLEAGNSIFVAENNKNEIVGFANGGKNRSEELPYDGELYAIYLLESAHRKGAGKQLFCNVAKELKDEGFHSMLVWVLNGNPADQFYLHFNPSVVTEKEISIGGEMLLETAYGWNEIDDILTVCP